MLRMLIFIHNKKWSNIFTDRWSTRVRTKSCLLMQSQDACYNDIITFPPIKITLSFSLKVRWQNGSRLNFLIPIDKESIPPFKSLGSPASFIIQPCLIEQAASGEYIPHFPKLQSGQWPSQGFHMNNVYEMCGEHFIFIRILPKRQQPVDYKARGSEKKLCICQPLPLGLSGSSISPAVQSILRNVFLQHILFSAAKPQVKVSGTLNAEKVSEHIITF